MNPAMWKKALRVIPSVSKETWGTLDLVSRWLISSRAAVLVMTFTSSAIAGLFAARDGGFRILPWLFMTLGLMLGHASNNLFNDYTDFVRGVDKDNYFRTMYGPQPVAHGLMTTRQLLGFFGGHLRSCHRLRGPRLCPGRLGPGDPPALRNRRGIRPPVHVAPEIHRNGRDFGPGRVGPADDRRRLLRADPSLELAGRVGQRSVRAGRDDGHPRQAHRQGGHGPREAHPDAARADRRGSGAVPRRGCSCSPRTLSSLSSS